MRKKLLAIVTVCALAMTSVVGCGNNNGGADDGTAGTNNGGNSDSTEDGDEEGGESEETIPENVITGSLDAEDAFVVWSWNTEIGARMDYFLEAYPEYADRIVYVNTGGSDYYQDKLDAILSDPSNAEYPDVIGLEADYILKYTNSDYTLDVKSIGITDEDMQYMYQYTIDTATVEDAVKALSWQAAPGAFTYRSDLAEEILGVTSPEEMQEKVATWDGFLEVAAEMKENGIKVLSGVDDVKRVYLAAREEAWVVDDVLQIEDVIYDYMDMAKTLYDNDYTNQTAQWSDAWNAGCALTESTESLDPVFAYFGCTWFLQWTIAPQSKGGDFGDDITVETSTYGKWNMCVGPQAYYWGGTWLAATKDCSDTDLAAELIRFMTCDVENLKNVAKTDLDYVNNTKAVEELLDEGEGAFDFLDNDQNYLQFFYDVAADIKIAPLCAEDANINSALDVQVNAYVTGQKDKDNAIADFQSAVLDQFGYLDVAE